MPMTNRKDPDPKLIAAMEEIKAVLKKHDICALVALCSEDALEFLNQFEASWSCCKLNGLELRVKTTGLDLTNEAKKKMIEDTIGMFLGFTDLINVWKANMAKVAYMMGEHLGEVEHRTINITPHRRPADCNPGEE